MIRFFRNLMEAIEIGAIYRARELARQQMLSMSDRTLEERGISRELLEMGVGYWPWRLDEVEDRQETGDIEISPAPKPADLGRSHAHNAAATANSRPDLESDAA